MNVEGSGSGPKFPDPTPTQKRVSQIRFSRIDEKIR
jgi:hypothetical protein